jgi:hypothetical protein
MGGHRAVFVARRTNGTNLDVNQAELARDFLVEVAKLSGTPTSPLVVVPRSTGLVEEHFGDKDDELVADRLDLLEPVLRAQVVEAKWVERNVRSGHGLELGP